MSAATSRFWAVVLVACLACWGCSQSPPETPADAAAGSGQPGQALPTAELAAPPAEENDPEDADEEEDELLDAEAESDPSAPEPEEGSPEWLIREAMRLRLAPAPETEDAEARKRHHLERNEKVIKLAQEVIERTHGDAEKQRLFDVAVHHLLEARLQLALQGTREQVDALYADAAAVYDRDPKSAAAAEGAHTLVNFAYTSAKQATGENVKKWLGEFARQARHFAEAFPPEERRSAPLLFTAARSCEIHGMTAEALDCYTLIQKQFPASSFAARVAPILRRLKLPGNPPQIAGPTLDGEHLVLDDLLGKPVLLVFWSSESHPFSDQLPRLLEVLQPRAKRGLEVVGISLDAEPDVVRQFTGDHKLTWPQIFFDDKPGWANPLAAYYGIMELPALWLIDQGGNVVSTSLSVDSLAEEIDRILPAGEVKSGDAPAKAEEESEAGDEAASDDASDAEEHDTILERHRKPGKKAGKAKSSKLD